MAVTAARAGAVPESMHGEAAARRTAILLVDDREDNLTILEEALSPLGQELVSVGSGEGALAALLDHDFALIILDVQMPGMDGFETAARIKGRRRTRQIPIIFITAADDDVEAALRAYAEGAVDYLVRPLNPHVLRSKAAVFVELHQATRLLRERTEELERSNAELAALAEAAEAANRSKTAFLNMVGHELRTPLAVVSGYSELLLDHAFGALGDNLRPPLQSLAAKSQELHELVEMLLQAAQVESGVPAEQPRPLDLNRVATEAVERARSRALMLGADLGLRLADAAATVLMGPRQLGRVLDNLVNNALSHGGERPWVRVGVAEGEPELWVEDRGPGIPEELGDRIFERFVRGSADGSGPPGVGLGLYICRELLSAGGATITVDAGEGGRGSRFLVRFPAQELSGQRM